MKGEEEEETLEVTEECSSLAWTISFPQSVSVGTEEENLLEQLYNSLEEMRDAAVVSAAAAAAGVVVSDDSPSLRFVVSPTCLSLRSVSDQI